MESVLSKSILTTNSAAGFVEKDGMRFSGTHLLIDIWEATNLNNAQEIESVLKDCAIKAGATVLHSYMHPFEPHGVSGVVVLAESHISIHTWPERNFAALDIFMCGDAKPYLAIDILKAYFKPGRISVNESRRGIIS